MNYLALDYGTKNIGLAYSVNGIISTLLPLKNDTHVFVQIQQIIRQFGIQKVYVGLSQGRVARLTLSFVDQLRCMIKLPIETVEEAVSTIEATDILRQNKTSKKQYRRLVDSVSAAVILRRVIN